MIEHSAGDLIVTVSADVGLAELNAGLSNSGQMLALDPPEANELTVAEVFDQALSGRATATVSPVISCSDRG